jgi:hypothetical protein
MDEAKISCEAKIYWIAFSGTGGMPFYRLLGIMESPDLGLSSRIKRRAETNG